MEAKSNMEGYMKFKRIVTLTPGFANELKELQREIAQLKVLLSKLFKLGLCGLGTKHQWVLDAEKICDHIEYDDRGYYIKTHKIIANTSLALEEIIIAFRVIAEARDYGDMTWSHIGSFSDKEDNR
jgi:hypothetical protein